MYQKILPELANSTALLSITSGLFIALLLAIFLLIRSYRSNHVRLLNGYLFSIVLAIFSLTITGLIMLSGNDILFMIWLAIVILIAVTLLFISIFLWLFLLINGIIMWRREAKNLANSLTLLLGTGLLVYPLLIDLLRKVLPSWLISLLNTVESLSMAYLLFNFVAFILSFLLLKMIRPKYNKDYIIVLGAGLINGNQVSKLLASRINRALNFAKKQIALTGKVPYIVLSGGQGTDEQLPEGQAMREYVIEQESYNPAYLLSETKSLNTLENMQFSKELIEAKGLDLNKGLFSTSDYHVYRATGYALFAGLDISGLGAKTRKYFIPSAILREYIAILMQHKRFHAFVFALILVVSVISTFLEFSIK
ncbi:putative membrane protein [Weissella oryzae SG25]|uniref:Putative membrane protein n=1 Tax=Weissella oryzae (strain DSM 25784 / JCM 18191 / LMG 30913 / SG25) TaxID=1329250 RepID=A0A069CZ77_WEIOS|nr:YdcF family protein [Weissella oryzae]GAK30361.1 putative membrane protein [Weissella oryzae SG25]